MAEQTEQHVKSINNRDTLREGFEEWFGSQGLWRAHGCARDRNLKGEYDDYLAEKYWQMYKKENHNE